MAEFAVIVIGVLVALLVESAWQERGERAEEREALERIRRELVADSLDRFNDEAWLRMARPSAEAAGPVLAGTDTLPGPAALAVVYGAVLVNTTLTEQGTWHDLTAAGRSELISDPELRGRLIRYYSQRDRRERARERDLPTELRTRVVSTLPITYTQVVLDRCARRARAPSELVEGARSDAFEALLRCDVVPDEGVDRFVTRLRAMPDVDLALGELRYGLRTFREEIVRTGEAFDALLAALDRAIAASR